jgi:hypothetical protein
MNLTQSWWYYLDGGLGRRKAATYTEQHKQRKGNRTSMSRVGFQPTVPVFEGAKTFLAIEVPGPSIL